MQALISSLLEELVSEAIIKIFYSYSRKDLDMRNTLEDHLSALRQANKISTWHDLELEAGTEWEPAILNKLDTADIILLLVSRNFIASKYCYGIELRRAIDRHTEGTARVIPIILRPCDWNHADVPFSKLNVLPTHAKAITSWSDQEEAFMIVAQKIRETVDQLRARKLAERQAKEQQAEQERIEREQQRQAEEQERLRQTEQLRQQLAAEEARRKQRELDRQRQEQLKQEAARKQQQATQLKQSPEATREKPVTAEAQAPTKVFVSYSWDSNNHKDRVVAVANTLRKSWGIEADIDEYVRAKPPYTPEQGWDLWMEKRIEWAEFVLIVCTETYKRRFRGDEEPGVGRGVTWEGTIIRQNLYNDQLRNTKFIPVVFSA
ncbi:TIR domain-containing protein [Leptolyngbya sp. FACHB-671]|uniref:TIR domain-containing protein n=1 Tax=Leptolyngbya sp. FACHB-671 TaxID=2692812 RepID=UPI0016828B33|nr:TIR domain-containing protein [Leptolyngbya sp. FACHB-671]MBD2071805.1 TIR domain-containing protein [Leptolyngbya sp. FACHB-671]